MKTKQSKQTKKAKVTLRPLFMDWFNCPNAAEHLRRDSTFNYKIPRSFWCSFGHLLMITLFPLKSSHLHEDISNAFLFQTLT